MNRRSSPKPIESLQVQWLKAALTPTMRDSVQPAVFERVAHDQAVQRSVQHVVENAITGRLREYRSVRLGPPKEPEGALIAQWIDHATPASLKKGLKPEFLTSVQQDIALHEEIRSIAMREVETQLTRG